MERDPINRLVRRSDQIMRGPRGRGIEGTPWAIIVCHLGDHPLLTRMAGIRFKKTHITNILALKDHHRLPRRKPR